MIFVAVAETMQLIHAKFAPRFRAAMPVVDAELKHALAHCLSTSNTLSLAEVQHIIMAVKCVCLFWLRSSPYSLLCANAQCSLDVGA